MADDTHPYRVVDRENQGWRAAGTADGQHLYAADYGWERDLADRGYAELEATRGPLRPVENITDADQDALETMLGLAGRKAVTTLAAALADVYHLILEDRQERDAYDFARRTLIAGREGSWESEVLISVMYFGRDMSLKRTDPAVREQMADLLWTWVASPDRYTEVAETLAVVVSSFADRHGGWKAIADQWLQPGGLAREDFSACYRLLYSHSEHFDTGLI